MTQEKALIYDDSFKQDLESAIYGIAFDLHNPDAARRLSLATQQTILNRFTFPGSFEPYRPSRPLMFTYYRIYVNRYTVFYYFRGNEMHVSRFIFSGSDADSRLK